jgi:CheY-like chemotaxis protein
VLIDYRLYYAQSQQFNEKLIQQLSMHSSRTILMTAISDQVSTQDFKSLGIDACLSKPITPKGLNKIIERLINSSKGDYQYSDPVKQTEDDPRQIKLLQGKHVLLVEDNPVNQMVAVSILKNMGMTIDVAKNGLDALLKLKTAEHHQFYEIILMDCQMPEMDGYETTLRIRAGEASEQVADIPIIAMTANAMQGDKKKCFEVGMDDYISKPININSVAKTLKKWVKQSHSKQSV